MTMQFIYDDGGRAAAGFLGHAGDCVTRAIVSRGRLCHAGDCVTRAIAIAAQMPYSDVYDGLNALAKRERPGSRERGRSSARNGVHKPTIRRYLESLGWTWTPTMGIGTGCRVHLADGELPIGRLIVSVSRHLVAVLDGVIHDTHDPQREVQAIQREPGWETAELRPGEWRNPNGICSVRRRCVYGYWKRGESSVS